MGDVFIENLVRKRRDAVTVLMFLGIVLGTLVAVVVLFLLGFYFFAGSGLEFLVFIGAIGACYGASKLVAMLYLEYETIVTNGDVDIDQITARNRRKRIFSLDCKEAEDFFRYDSGRDMSKYNKVIYACDAKDSPNLWCIVAKKDKGLTAVVFNGTEKVLGAIRPFLPRPLALNVPRPGEQK